MPLNPRALAAIESAHVPYSLMPHPQAWTADEVAASAHVSAWHFAKVVVLENEAQRPLMVVLPATRHVDLGALRDISGEKHLALIDEVRCRALFPDCEVGAMPPLGHAYDMPLYVDACLARAGELVFNAGTHQEVARMAWGDFVRVARPVVAEFCR